MPNSGITWILYAPQFHIAISIVALICLGINIASYRLIRRIARKFGP